MVDRAIGEATTHGQARVTGPENDGSGLHLMRLQPGTCPDRLQRVGYFTSTVMFVGFAMTSKTAERFCDCATSASMSSFDASASIV